MKCNRVQPKLVEYAEDSLNEKGRTRVEKHLQSCPTCAHELHEIEKTLKLIQSVPIITPPPEKFWTNLTSSVMRKINRMEPTRNKSMSLFYFPRFRLAMAFLIFIIFIFTGVYVYYKNEFQLHSYLTHILRPDSGSEDIDTPLPDSANGDDTIETVLNTIVSDELKRDILEQELALFDREPSITFDMARSDDMVYFLISTLSEEEKKVFLTELQKMK